MTSKIKLYPLRDFQSDTQIASLVDFSNDYWEFGGWEADAFGEDDTFPDKLGDTLEYNDFRKIENEAVKICKLLAKLMTDYT